MKKPRDQKAIFVVSRAYKATWTKYYKKYPHIKESLTDFNNAKRKIPPGRLPDKMKDHILKGPLDGLENAILISTCFCFILTKMM